MNNKQEGFQEIQNEAIDYIHPQAFLIMNNTNSKSFLKNQNKITYKSPFTIFHNILITESPFQNTEFIQKNNQLEQISQHKQEKINQNQLPQVLVQEIKKKQWFPLQILIVKQQKINLNYTNQSFQNLIEKVQNYFPKKFICVYNKFQENVFLKNDLTIIIKNVQKYQKLQLLKPIQSKFILPETIVTDNNVKHQNQVNRKNKSSSLTVKPSKRYQDLSKQKQNNNIQITFRKSMILRNSIKNKNSQIQFFSNFQSGNLHLVFKDKNVPNLYYLFLSNDINTHGFNQWFYFGIKANIKKKFRFIIVNISKQFKYTEQMKLLSFQNNQWKRQIPFLFYSNKFSRYSGGNLMSLDFQYTFQEKINQSKQRHIQPIYLAFSHPYTYTKLINFMRSIKTRFFQNLNVIIESAGKSELKNYIPLIKITESNKNKKIKKKNTILILARQHAGQTSSSFICQNIISILINEQDRLSLSLIQKYDFLIIPMANPDGVVHGNSRTNIKGYDINRLWEIYKTSSIACNETASINKYLINYSKNNTIQYMIDLHSHSKQFGSFTYSCENNQAIKLFNYYFSLKCEQVRYDKCIVNINYQKKCTFRGQMYHRMKILNGITIQTSFYGYYKKISENCKKQKLIAFKLNNYQNIAKGILESIQQIYLIKQKKQKLNQINKIIEQLNNKIKQDKNNCLKQQKIQNNQSDSDPQNQYLEIQQRHQNKQQIILNKKISDHSFKFLQDQCKQKTIQKQSDKKSYKKNEIMDKSKRFITQNKSSIYSLNSYQNLHESLQNKRKKIYSMRNGHNSLINISEINSHNFDNADQLCKRYENKQKQAQFRKTLRRSYKISSSLSNFNSNKRYSGKKSSQTLQQSKNFIVYPTAADIGIKSYNMRQLHDTLFQGKYKVKQIKQQSRILKRMGKQKIFNQTSFNQIQKNSTAQSLTLKCLTAQKIVNLLKYRQ